MYRIELTPGEVTVFRTIEELATGVRNGLITSKARIYHNASEKWLPIEFHPHYKRARDLASRRASEPPAAKSPAKSQSKPSTLKPGDLLQPETLTFLSVPLPPSGTAPLATSAPATPAPSPEAPRAVAPAPSEPPTGSPRAESPAEATQADSSPPAFLRGAPASFAFAPPAAPPETGSRNPGSQAPVAAPSPVTLRPFDRAPAAPSMFASRPFGGPPTVEAVDESDDSVPDTVWPRPAPADVPPVTASPVLDLPRIDYPEITPLEEPIAASGTSPRRRTLHLAGAMALLALGGYASSSLLSVGRPSERFVAAGTLADAPASAAPSPSVPAARQSMPAPAPAKPATSIAPASPGAAEMHADKQPGRVATVGPKPAAVTPAPAPASEPLPPASSGFARALEPRAIVNAPAPSASKPAEAKIDSTAPPAIDTKVALPVLPGAALPNPTPRAQGDSAMKKILRAVSGGGKDAR